MKSPFRMEEILEVNGGCCSDGTHFTRYQIDGTASTMDVYDEGLVQTVIHYNGEDPDYISSDPEPQVTLIARC